MQTNIHLHKTLFRLNAFVLENFFSHLFSYLTSLMQFCTCSLCTVIATTKKMNNEKKTKRFVLLTTLVKKKTKRWRTKEITIKTVENTIRFFTCFEECNFEEGCGLLNHILYCLPEFSRFKLFLFRFANLFLFSSVESFFLPSSSSSVIRIFLQTETNTHI